MKNKSKLHEMALSRVDGVGSAAYVRLIDAFGSAEKVFKVSADDLICQARLRPAIAQAISSFADWCAVEEELKLASQKSIQIIAYHDSLYPERLRQIVGAPALLYVMGRTDVLGKGDWLGVVGSRTMTPYGEKACRQIVSDIVSHGVGVVSGFAKGVDITAHLAAMEARGLTIAVLGGGLNFVYPQEHKRHVSRLLAAGCLVSEFPLNEEPRPEFFPRRNRIISGFSRGVLVVEAAVKSGSLITAQYAAEQNRDVFALPGSIFWEISAGCNRLIQQGAKLVTNAEDILREWSDQVSTRQEIAFSSGEERAIYEACAHGVFSADEIIEKTNLPAAQIGVLLTKLEMEGRLRSHPGKRYESV